MMKDCYTLKGKQQNRSDSRKYSSRNAFYIENIEESQNTTHYEAQVTDAAENNLDEWLIDSAATSHFCKERGWFKNFRDLPPTDILIGDKNSINHKY